VPAVEYTVISVADAKTAEGVVVKAAGLKDDVLQSQSASAANPAYNKWLAELFCTRIISFAVTPHLVSLYTA
jgi:hypothetical protein